MEKILDSLFVDQKVHETSLRMLVLEIARLQGELRLVHLKTHVAMQHALSPQQIAQYDELRG